MTNTNLPISGLTEQKFNLQKIKDEYFDDDKNFDVDEKLIYFAVAYLNGSNYVSRKMSWANLMQSYTYSQQFICDLTEILHMNDVIQNYDFYHGNTQIIPENNKIVIPDNTAIIESLIDEQTIKINNLTTKLNNVSDYRVTYDISFDCDCVLTQHPHNCNPQKPNISFTNNNKTLIYTINHPLSLVNLPNIHYKTPNVKLYEKKNENFSNNFNIYGTSVGNQNNYREEYFDVLIHKEISINQNNNYLIIKLFFENTSKFNGKLLIN